MFLKNIKVLDKKFENFFGHRIKYEFLCGYISKYLNSTIVSNRDEGIQNEPAKTSINLCLLMLR